MKLLDLAPEILDLIIRQLDPSDLGSARLTSLLLDGIAIHHLFNTIQLIPRPESVAKWKAFAYSEKLRKIPRHITIHTFPETESRGWWDLRDNDLENWDPDRQIHCEADKHWYEDGKTSHECYYDMFQLLSRFPRVDSLQLSFTQDCDVEEEGYSMTAYALEHEDRRREILANFFDAIHDRAEEEANSTIRSLTVKYLQNAATDELVQSEAFRSCLSALHELNIRVTTEYNEPGPDHDLYKLEHQTFPPFLREHWLEPYAKNLTSLSLYWRNAWGALPATFDTTGLVFPCLRSLALGQYTIAHDEQMDWVFAQPELQTLILYDCPILRSIRIYSDQVEEWHVNTADWSKMVSATAEEHIYEYSRTWSKVFDQIRTQLPKLRRFLCNWEGFESLDYENPDIEDRYSTGTVLSAKRYWAFNSSLLPTPWFEPRRDDGLVDYGHGTANWHIPHWDEDKKSFDELLKVVGARSG